MESSIVFGAFQFDRKGQANQKLLLEACEKNGIQEIDSGIIYVSDTSGVCQAAVH